jgi:hypothetical protein
MHCAPRLELLKLEKVHENKMRAWCTFTTSNKKPKGKERLQEINFLEGFLRIQDKVLIDKIKQAKKTQGAAIRYQKGRSISLSKLSIMWQRGRSFEFLQNEAKCAIKPCAGHFD